jgi:anti-sigma-K factor RskA
MSTPGPGHGAWSDSLGAYMLGALPAEECAGFEAHLEVCAACRDDVADLQAAADALPASVPQVVPPPELKGRIMAVVESEAALLAAAGERADRPEGAPVAPTPAPAREAEPRRGRFRGWTLRPALAAGLAAALLLVGGLGGALLAGGGPEAQTVTASVDPAQAPGARVTLQVRDGSGMLVAERMPPPPRGRVYQVWIKRPGRDPQPTSALWSVRGDGSAEVAVPGSLDGVEAVLVTSEPNGGSDVPSRAPVIAAQPA